MAMLPSDRTWTTRARQALAFESRLKEGVAITAAVGLYAAGKKETGRTGGVILITTQKRKKKVKKKADSYESAGRC